MGLFDTLSCDVSLALDRPTVNIGGVLRGTATFKITKEMTVRGLRVQVKSTDFMRYSQSDKVHWVRTEDVWKTEITFAGVPSDKCKQEPIEAKQVEPSEPVKATEGRVLDDDEPTAAAAPATTDALLEEGKLLLPVGTYVYPFEVELPANLPPTYEMSHWGKVAEVSCKAKAYADIRYGLNASSTQPVALTAPLRLSQLAQRCPTVLPREQRPLKKFLMPFISKGDASLSIESSAGVVTPVDPALPATAAPTITVEFDLTHSAEPVRHVEVQLMGIVRLHYTEKFRGGLETDRDEEIGEAAKIMGPFAEGKQHRVQVQLPVPTVDAVLRRDRESYSRCPSYNAHTTKLEHFVKVELNMPWTSNPDFVLPVFYAPMVDPTDTAPELSTAPAQQRKRMAEIVVPVDHGPYVVPTDPAQPCAPVPGHEPRRACPPMARVVGGMEPVMGQLAH